MAQAKAGDGLQRGDCTNATRAGRRVRHDQPRHPVSISKNIGSIAFGTDLAIGTLKAYGSKFARSARSVRQYSQILTFRSKNKIFTADPFRFTADAGSAPPRPVTWRQDHDFAILMRTITRRCRACHMYSRSGRHRHNHVQLHGTIAIMSS
jgi:hypothetical protein